MACTRAQELELWEEDEDEFLRLLLPNDLVSTPLPASRAPPGLHACLHGGLFNRGVLWWHHHLGAEQRWDMQSKKEHWGVACGAG